MSGFPIREDDKRPWRYRMVVGIFRLIFGVTFGRRIRFHGLENLPRQGPYIVAANHLSALDPLIVGAYFPRTLFAMAKKELFKNRLVGWALWGSNVFPVDRGTADRTALNRAIKVLTNRWGRLLIFVEGTRATKPGMKRAEPGVGFLQRRSGAPVVPVAIWGAEKALPRGSFFPRRCDIHFAIGAQFTPASPPTGKRDDQAIADEVAGRIAALLPPEYRGAYATSGS